VPEREVIGQRLGSNHQQQIAIAEVASLDVVDLVAASVAAKEDDHVHRRVLPRRGRDGGKLLALGQGEVIELGLHGGANVSRSTLPGGRFGPSHLGVLEGAPLWA